MSDAVMGSAAEKGGWLPAASDAESGVQVAVATSGFAQWIDRAIAWVCLFSLVPVLIAASVDADKVHLPWLISIAGGLTVVAALMPVFARRAAVFKALAAAYGVVVLVGLLTWPVGWIGTSQIVRPPWLWLCLGLATICVALASNVRIAMVYNAVAAITYLLIRILPGSGVGLALGLQDVLVLVVQPAGLLLGLSMLRDTVVKLDAALATAHGQRADTAVKDALVTARSRLDAIVHDEVMTTLVAAANSTGRHDPALVEQSRQAQQSLVDASASAASDEPITVEQFSWLVQDIVESVSTNSAITVQAPAEIVSLPSDAVGTLVQAVREATLNASKHSRADHVRVEVDIRVVRRRPQVTVDVVDDGVGFSMADVPRERLGIRVSLIERMHTIGGDAEIESAPGQGTRVRLTWSNPAETTPPEPPPRAMLDPLENPLLSRIERRPFRWLGYGLMGLYMLVGVLCIDRVEKPGLLVLALLLAAVAIYVAMYNLGLAVMSQRHAWTVVGLALAVTLCCLLAMPQGPWPQYTTWFASATMLLLIMVLSGPQEGIAWAGAAVHFLLVMVMGTVHPGMTFLQAIDPAIVPAAWLGVCLFLLRWLDQIHEQVRAVEMSSRAEASQQAVTFSKLVLREVWLTELMGMVGPMLTRIADPDADFTELDRRMFLAVEGGLRDSIRAANLTSRELSYAIGEARIRGVSVTLVDNRGAVLPEALRRSVIGLMQQIVSEAQAGRIVARVAPEGYDDAVTILRVDENGGSRLVKISEDGRITS